MKKGIIATIIIIILGIGIGVYISNKNNKENEIYGIVLNATKDSIEINDDGNIYNFNIKTALKPETEIIVEDIIKIKYKGELKNNTAAIEIKIIKDVSVGQTNTSENTISKNTITKETTNNTTEETTNNITKQTINETTNKTTNNEKKETTTNDEHYLTGIVTNITMNTIEIKANYDGKTYTFNTQNAKKDNNIGMNATVKIIHKGKVVDQQNKDTIDAINIKKINN